MKWAYETAPSIARVSFRVASSSEWCWPARWSGDPSVLLADEPTGNLDFRTGEMIMDLLEDLHRSRRLTSIARHPQFEFRAPRGPALTLERGHLASLPVQNQGVQDQGSREQGRNYV